jgi:hypothetical protein
METSIIIEGKELPLTSLDWLMKQDLQFLYTHIASGFIFSQTQEGGAGGLLPEPHVKSIFVLLFVLDEMRKHQAKWIEAQSGIS